MENMNNSVKSMCMMFKSGRELSSFLLEHKIHLFFVEGVDGVGKTTLLNDVGVQFTHFPTAQCTKDNPSPFDYAVDIMSTVYGKVKEAAVGRLEKYPALDSVNLYFDRGFMSTLAYSPTIIQEYMRSYEPYFYIKDGCAWDLWQDVLFQYAVDNMMSEYIKDPTTVEWFMPLWIEFLKGLLQCPYVHIVYLPSYDSQGLVERLKQRGLSEDMALLEHVGESGLQQQLEERLEAYDFMRLLFCTLPMVCHRHDKEIEGDFVRLFITKDEFKRVVNNKNKPVIKHGHLIENPLSITF